MRPAQLTAVPASPDTPPLSTTVAAGRRVQRRQDCRLAILFTRTRQTRCTREARVRAPRTAHGQGLPCPRAGQLSESSKSHLGSSGRSQRVATHVTHAVFPSLNEAQKINETRSEALMRGIGPFWGCGCSPPGHFQAAKDVQAWVRGGARCRGHWEPGCPPFRQDRCKPPRDHASE